MLTKPDIDWLKSEFLPALADAVQKRLETKLNEVSKKLDKFVSDIEAKRQEQTLHNGQHERTDKRLTRLEKNAHLIPFAD